MHLKLVLCISCFCGPPYKSLSLGRWLKKTTLSFHIFTWSQGWDNEVQIPRVPGGFSGLFKTNAFSKESILEDSTIPFYSFIFIEE